MKALKKTMMMVLLALATVSLSQAQETDHLRWIDIQPFNQVQLQLDVDVILVQSPRNKITLQGDSTTIANLSITEDEGILAIDYADTNSAERLTRVLIEYQDIDMITTGGYGTYHFTNLDQRELAILNPVANVFMKGKTGRLNLISMDGYTNLSELKTRREVIFVSNASTVVDASDKAKYFVYNDN